MKIVFTLALYLACVCMPAPVAAQEKAAPLTRQEFEQGLITWNTRRLTEAYKVAHPDCTAENAKEVEEFFVKFSEFLGGSGDAQDVEIIIEAERNLAIKNIDDAMLRGIKGYLKAEIENWPQAYFLLEDTLKPGALDPYPLDLAAILALTASRTIVEGAPNDPGAPAALKTGCGLLTAALREREWSPLEQRYLAANLSIILHEDRLPATTEHDAVALALKAAGEKNAWLVQYLLGVNATYKAWIIRGHEFVDKVPDAAWAGFHKGMKTAYGHFRAAYDMRPDHPESAANLITVAMVGETPANETTRFWFDRAVKAQFDYLDAYNAYANSIRPRWNGSYEEMLEFGKECAATGRYDTRVPYFYYSAVQDIAKDSKDHFTVWREQYTGLRTTLIKLAEAGSPRQRDLDFTRLVILDCFTREYTNAMEDLARLENPTHLVTDLVSAYGSSPAKLIEDIRAYGGPAGDEIRLMNLKMNERKWDEAIEAANAADIKVTDEKPEIRAAVTMRAGATRLAARFIKGGEISPEFGQGLAGWATFKGKWETKAPDSVGSNRYSILIGRAPLTRRYQVSADITLPAPTVAKREATLAFGWHWNGTEEKEAFSITLERNGEVHVVEIQSLVQNEIDGELEKKTLGNKQITRHDGPYHFVVQVWGNHRVVKVDEETVFAGEVTSEKGREPNGDRLGFITNPTAEFNAIKLLKLETRPQELGPETDPKLPAPTTPKQAEKRRAKPKF